MDYDFSGLCADQLEKLEKRLDSLAKANVKEYSVALNVINNSVELQNRCETIQEIIDLLDDQIRKTVGGFTATMNTVQKALGRYL